jgi:hypothetical protein
VVDLCAPVSASVSWWLYHCCMASLPDSPLCQNQSQTRAAHTITAAAAPSRWRTAKMRIVLTVLCRVGPACASEQSLSSSLVLCNAHDRITLHDHVCLPLATAVHC